MSYKHDIFISYRRQLAWTPWTRDHLKRFLESYLQQELGEAPDIFVDERVRVAEDWVESLAMHLAHSKIVVAVLSRDYFQSPWCVHELDMILDRNEGKAGLFIPIIVHDCEALPEAIDRSQAVSFKDFRITDMNRAGQTYEDFSNAVKQLAPTIAEVIHAAPAFEGVWAERTLERFNAIFEADKNGSRVPPTHFIPPPLAAVSLPRLKPWETA